MATISPLSLELKAQVEAKEINLPAIVALLERGADLFSENGALSPFEVLCQRGAYQEISALAVRLSSLPNSQPLVAQLLGAAGPHKGNEGALNECLRTLLSCGASPTHPLVIVAPASDLEEEPDTDPDPPGEFSPLGLAFSLRLEPCIFTLLEADPSLQRQAAALLDELDYEEDEPLFRRVLGRLTPSAELLEQARYLARIATERGKDERVEGILELLPSLTQCYPFDLLPGMLVMAEMKLSLLEMEQRLSHGGLSSLLFQRPFSLPPEDTQQSYQKIARLFLERGCKLHLESGEPLLHLAARERPYIIPVLLEYGADPAERDLRGQLAEELCMEGGAAELLRACRHARELEVGTPVGRAPGRRL